MQAADPSELAPGTLIDGRYRVVRVIGVGGTGIVYEVEHDRTGQHLALKTLLDPAQAPRLEQEARALARLRSPHVVKVVELGHCDAGPFMVMTLLVGRNLRDVLESKVKLPLSFVANLAVQVCEGLDEAHRIGLVHRDLKPDNMHLADPADADTETTGPFGGGPTSSKTPHDLTFVTVFDFGVVKMSEANSALTRTGSTVGTPYYMSLEQLRGAGTVDAQSDVYALCVVLYECLAGQRPFEAGTLGDLIFAICSITPVHLATARPDLPREITDTVMRGLSREKKERPPTMRDLAKVFAAHADPSFTTWLRVGDPPAPRPSQGGLISGLPPSQDNLQRVEVRPISAGPSEPPTAIGPSPFASASPSAPAPAPAAPPAASAQSPAAPPLGPPAKPPSTPGLLSRPTASAKPVDEPSFVSAPARPSPPVLAPTPPPPPPPSGSGLAPRPPSPAPAEPPPPGDAGASRNPPRPMPPPPRIAALRSTSPLVDMKPPRRDAPAAPSAPPKPAVAGSAPSGAAPASPTIPIVSPMDEESSSGERDTPTEMFVPKVHGELEDVDTGAEVSASTSLAENGAMPTMSLPAELALPKMLPEDKTAILDIAALQKNPPSPSPNYAATAQPAPSSVRGPSSSSQDIAVGGGGMIPTTTLPQVGGPSANFAQMTSRIEFGPTPAGGGPRPLVSSSTDVAGLGRTAPQASPPKAKWEEVLQTISKHIDAVAKKAEAKFRAASQEVQIAVVVIGAAMLAMFLVLFVWAFWL